VETVRLTRICEEDLDVGSGTRSVRLADGSVATLHQVSVPGLCPKLTVRLSASNGASTLTATGLIPSGARVLGVTTKIITTFGTTGGLTGFAVGDATSVAHWGSQTTLTAGAETSQRDFTDAGQPINNSAAASDVILSALSGTFDATGQVEVQLTWFLLTHRSA
jgi:hypothetical protein